LTDSKGRTVDFKNTVLIMTSNLGSREIQSVSDDEKQVREAVTQVLQDHFKPEFLNRIDDIVIFHRLSREQISQIIDVQLERLRQMLHERNIAIVLEDSAKDLLSREGYDPNFGARPLKRAIQTLIQNPLAMKLLRGEILPGQTVTVSARNDEMVFATNKVAAAA
jgi:ATP-dependent Clp protease ATP-binding subunit ClpB